VKNIVLLIIAVLLATFTYFFEEIGSQDRAKEKELQIALFNFNKLGPIKGFSTENISLVADKTLYRDRESGQLISQKIMNQVFTILSSIKMTRIVPVEKTKGFEKNFIPSTDHSFTFHFETTDIKVVLGKQLEFSQSFYLKVISGSEEKIVVGHDSTPLKGSYMKQDFHRNTQKYTRLKNMLGLGPNFFFDKHLFPKMYYSKGRLNWKSIKIDNFRNRLFSIDLSSYSITPRPLPGVEVSKVRMSEIGKSFIEFSGNNIYLKFDKSLLKNMVSAVYLTSNSGDESWIKLYKEYNKEEGYFLLSSSNQLFSIGQKKASIFFSNMQNFWTKKLMIPKSDFNFRLKIGQKAEQILVSNKQKFVTSSKSKITKHNEFKKLISFFEKEASRVSELDNTSRVLFKNPLMSFSFMENEFDVIFRDNEVMALNKKTNVVYYYLVASDLSFSTDYNAYFKSR